MTGTFDLFFVAVSYAISVFGSYAGLVLAGQVTDLHKSTDRVWLVGAAIALGGGAIWAMHFIGMLAYKVPIPVTYDATLTLISMVVAIVFVGFGVYTVKRQQQLKLSTLVGGGVIMGLGVGAMHYTGMAAMKMAADPQHDLTIVGISLVIAIVASIAALWIALTMRETWQKIVSAFVMGVAVCGMHYTAMYGFSMTPNKSKIILTSSTILANDLTGYVAVATVIVLSAALVAAFAKELVYSAKNPQ